MPVLHAAYVPRAEPRRHAILRRLASAAVAVVVGLWLFGDTLRHRLGHATPENKVRFSHFGTYEDFEFWRETIAEFERRNPTIRVRQEYVVGVAGEYNTKLRQQILTGTLPDAALIQLAPFRETGDAFTDLTGWADDGGPLTDAFGQFDPVAHRAYIVDGRLRGVPFSGGNLLIYCNETCFSRAEVARGRAIPRPSADWTWSDFQAAAEALTCDLDGDGEIDQFGFWLPRWLYYLPFIWGAGAEVSTDDGTHWLFRGPEAEDALRFYRTLAVERRVTPRDEEVPQLFQDVAFLTGKVAMCVNGPWFQSFLERTSLADGYRVEHIPRGAGGRFTRVTWDGIVVAPNIRPSRLPAVQKFVAYLSSLEVHARMGASGRALPARIDARQAFSSGGGGRDPRRMFFVDALDYSRTQPLTPGFSEVDRAINRALQDLIDPHRDANAADILEKLARDSAVRRAFPDAGSASP